MSCCFGRDGRDSMQNFGQHRKPSPRLKKITRGNVLSAPSNCPTKKRDRVTITHLTTCEIESSGRSNSPLLLMPQNTNQTPAAFMKTAAVLEKTNSKLVNSKR